MIEARGLAVGYGVRRVLEDVDLTLAPGRLHVLLGANGAGKSTLLRTLAGLQAPLAGETRCGGLDAPHRAAPRLRAARIAYVQPPEVEPPAAALTVREAVALGRTPYHPWWSWRRGLEDDVAVAAALERCGLEALAARPLAQLSGGELQRAWLAAALAQGAPCLLLDEPTARLDPRHAREAMTSLAAAAATGATVVASMHDVGLAAAHAATATLLGEGRVVATGRTAAVLTEANLRRAYDAPISVRSIDGETWVRVR